MADKRIRQIRKRAIDLVLFDGADVLFVAEIPDDPVGQGVAYLFGGKNSPTAFLCARRTLNELKHHLKKAGLNLEYTITQMEKESE